MRNRGKNHLVAPGPVGLNREMQFGMEIFQKKHAALALVDEGSRAEATRVTWGEFRGAETHEIGVSAGRYEIFC